MENGEERRANDGMAVKGGESGAFPGPEPANAGGPASGEVIFEMGALAEIPDQRRPKAHDACPAGIPHAPVNDPVGPRRPETHTEFLGGGVTRGIVKTVECPMIHKQGMKIRREPRDIFPHRQRRVCHTDLGQLHCSMVKNLGVRCPEA